MSLTALNTTVSTPLPARLAALGPWALVTGASDGIGAATTRELADTGFNLILTDLGQPQGVARMMQALSDSGIAMSEIGVAVLAAGYGTTGALADVDIEAERDMLRVNCDAVLHLSHLFATSMTTRGAGQLVLFGSIVGFQGNAMTANYAASKAYVQSLAEGLSVELRPAGVHVLSVAPGPIATGFAARAGMTMGPAGTPEVVGKAIVRRLGRSGTIRTGMLSKVLGYNMAMTPRPLRVRIMSGIMAGIAKGKAATDPATQEA